MVVVVFLIILRVFPDPTLLEEDFVEVLREILRAVRVDEDFFCLVVFGVFFGRIDLVLVVFILPVGDPHAGDDCDQSDENHVDGSDETRTLGGVVLEFVADDTATSNGQAGGQNRGVEDVVEGEKFRDGLEFVGEVSGVEEVTEEELEEFVGEEETEDEGGGGGALTEEHFLVVIAEHHFELSVLGDVLVVKHQGNYVEDEVED